MCIEFAQDLPLSLAVCTCAPQDYIQALELFQMAADKGSAEAQYYLGHMFRGTYDVQTIAFSFSFSLHPSSGGVIRTRGRGGA